MDLTCFEQITKDWCFSRLSTYYADARKTNEICNSIVSVCQFLALMLQDVSHPFTGDLCDQSLTLDILRNEF
jgi:hypothetical protein